MASTEVIQGSFRRLQPLCVRLTQTPDVPTMKELQQVLNELPKEALDEMQEYIMFPMRFILKQPKTLSEELQIRAVQGLTSVLEKTEVSRWQMFTDIFTSLCVKLGPPQAEGKLAAYCEELKLALMLCIKQLLLSITNSVVASVYSSSYLPALGHCVSLLLAAITQHEQPRALRIEATHTLAALAQVHRKVGVSRKLAIGDVFASFLPGILMALTKVCNADSKQGHKIVTSALSLWHHMAVLVLGDKNLPADTTQPSKQPPNRAINQSASSSNPIDKLTVKRNNSWVKGTAEKVCILIGKVAGIAPSSSNWRVRESLADWAAILLMHCGKSLSASIPQLLELLVSLLGDDYPSVSGSARKALTDYQQQEQEENSQRPLLSVLLDNLYSLTTALPRLIRTAEDHEKLSSLRTLSGYMSLLGPRVCAVLRSHQHVQRLSHALMHVLELDCTQIHVLQETTLGSPYTDLSGMGTSLPPRRYFKHFDDKAIYTEISHICQMLGYYGQIEVVLDPFLEQFEQTSFNRKQTALVINNLVLGLIKDESDGNEKTQQKMETAELEILIRSLVDIYLSAEYLNLPTRDQSESLLQPSASNKAFDWQIVSPHSSSERGGAKVEHYNSNILQICALLEGIGCFAKVLGPNFQYLLMDVLYPVLEKLGDENAMISQAAYLALGRIANACQYRDIASLLQENADYLVNSISLRLRHLDSNPRAPTVLRVVITYCGGPGILLHIQDTVDEVLSSLDQHYGTDAVQFMQVLSALVQAIEKWHPHETETETTNEGSKSEAKSTTTCEKNESIADFLVNLHKEKTAADDFEFEEPESEIDPDMDIPEESETNEEEKKVVPIHIKMVTEVFERCRHMLSEEPARLRLLVLDTVAHSCTALAGTYQDELLPLVHRVWPAFVQRFTDQEPLVTIRACQVLEVLGRCSGDFIRQRVVRDVLPKLCDYLQKQALISEKAGTAYRYTVSSRLQQSIVGRAGSLCASAGLLETQLTRVMTACVPYLSARQPRHLQEACFSSFLQFISVDPDSVWLTLNDLHCPTEYARPSAEFKDMSDFGTRTKNEFMDNVTKLLESIG